MAALTVQQVVLTGLEATYAAAAGGGDSFVNDGHTFVDVINGSGGDITVTIAVQSAADALVDGLTVPDRTVVVTAAERRQIGPFAKGIYNDANGKVQLTYSGVTSLTIAALKFIS